MHDDRIEFYQAHLDRVSRSFAFCISQLEAPLREWIGLSYLLCRVVDTIEDAAWDDADRQVAAFALFDVALDEPERVADLANLAQAPPPGITEDERALLEVAPRLLDDFHRLPEPVRAHLHGPIRSMSRGMQHFARRRPLVLRSLAEVNQYCFFVAGVVGELLARLLAEVEPGFTCDAGTISNAHHFGQFLQKVNVLKDQVDDESRGRRLVPDRGLIESSVWANARHALAFILSVPRQQLEFRRFCAWSFFMGLESLIVAKRSVAAGRVLAIARERNVELLGEVEDILHDDSRLSRLFDRFLERLHVDRASAPAVVAGDPPAWLGTLYDGSLDQDHLRRLGL